MTWNGSSTTPGINVITGVNDITGGLFGVSILVLIWLVVYYRTRGEPTRESAVAASWVTLIAAVLLRLLGWLDDTYLGICIVLALGSLALLVNRN